tara:strand:+ start:194 stop:418 length:225 start_codon:yes stop_codon:yes gene_type:complete
LLGESPKAAPYQAIMLYRMANVGSWCTANLLAPSGTESVEMSQNSGQAIPPFEAPHKNKPMERNTIGGKKETNE